MKPVGKAILIIVVVLIALPAIGVLFINLYVQSAKVHARIERKLGDALHAPLKINRVTFTPWRGVKIAGITVPQTNPPGAGNFLEAPSFIAHLRFWPLFWRKLIIEKITVTEPKVVWLQNERGQWKPPSPPIEPDQPDGKPVAAETPKADTGTKPAAAQNAPELPRTRPFEIFVNRLQIDRGSFDFLDRNQKSIASFAGVNVRCPDVTFDLVKGTAACSKVSLFDLVFAQNFKTSFAYSASGELSLPDLKTAVAGGNVRGSFGVKNNEPDSPFVGDVQFDGVDLNQLIVEAGGQSFQATGTIKGYLDLSGLTRNGASTNGRGGISLSNGQIKEYEFLQMLGQALQIEELVQLNLQQAQVDFRIDDGKAWIDQLVLQSQNLTLTASGTVKPDGKMELHAHLSVNQKISRQLPNFVIANFKPVENSEMRSLDFDVNGTLAKPRTNIVQRMLGSEIQKQATDLLQSIFGKKKKDNPKRDDKKTAPAPTPAEPAAEPDATQ